VNTPIRSFVRRDSRITPAQKTALARDWERYALPPVTGTRDLSAAFGREAPLNLEIGAGDGACIAELAERNPGENFIAVEVYRPGLGRIVSRAAAADLRNLRVSDTDVCDLLATVIEPVFSRVFIFFPDPWPKKRHHKRRLLKPAFFDLLGPRLLRHGRVFIATDCLSYAESILETADRLSDWVNLAGPGRTSPRPRFRAMTKFERRAAAAGSTVYEFTFARR